MTDWLKANWLPLAAGALIALAIHTKAWTWMVPALLALLGEGGRRMKGSKGDSEGGGGSEMPDRPSSKEAETSSEVSEDVSEATSDISNADSERELADELGTLADDLEQQREE